MKEIIDYKLLWENDSSKLDKLVKELIRKGYQPFNGVSITTSADGLIVFAQVMVKYEL